MIITRSHSEREVPGKASQFTGLASGDVVLPSVDGITINSVTFAPGARTHWHQHEQGQILLVTSGYGLVCSEGGPVERISTGDTVWVPPGESHWHGAGPESFMTHTAISIGSTLWADPVLDSDYTGSTATKEDK